MQHLHKSFRNIGLIGRPGKSSVVDTLNSIYHFLLERGLRPIFDQETAELYHFGDVQTCSRA